MTKLMQRIYFYYISCFFVKCSKYAKLHSKLWIKGSSLKEVPWNSLFSSSRQKNGIRSINLRYTLLPSLGVQLSGEVPFVISEWLVWELPPDNQRVSNWLFERSPIIIVVGSVLFKWLHFFSRAYREKWDSRQSHVCFRNCAGNGCGRWVWNLRMANVQLCRTPI